MNEMKELIDEAAEQICLDGGGEIHPHLQKFASGILNMAADRFKGTDTDVLNDHARIALRVLVGILRRMAKDLTEPPGKENHDQISQSKE